MRISAITLTDSSLIDKACSFTVDKEVKVKNYHRMYKSEHSPIRTKMFWIEMYDIPSFVSTHFVRHKFGVEHFVKSLRDDRGGTGTEDRMSPVNHAMLVNAQALINMARKRLCTATHVETQVVMLNIHDAIAALDPDLARCMVVDCVYRGGCHEFHNCGFYEREVLNG